MNQQLNNALNYAFTASEKKLVRFCEKQIKNICEMVLLNL